MIGTASDAITFSQQELDGQARGQELALVMAVALLLPVAVGQDLKCEQE